MAPSVWSPAAIDRNALFRCSEFSTLSSMNRYSVSLMTASIPRKRSTTEAVVKYGATTPIVLVFPRESPRASELGRYPSSAMTSSTRRRVASATNGLSLSTRETVPTPTPARVATSKMVATEDPPPQGYQRHWKGFHVLTGRYQGSRPAGKQPGSGRWEAEGGRWRADGYGSRQDLPPTTGGTPPTANDELRPSNFLLPTAACPPGTSPGSRSESVPAPSCRGPERSPPDPRASRSRT